MDGGEKGDGTVGRRRISIAGPEEIRRFPLLPSWSMTLTPLGYRRQLTASPWILGEAFETLADPI